MAEEPDNLVLQLLRNVRVESSARFDEMTARLDDIECRPAQADRRSDAPGRKAGNRAMGRATIDEVSVTDLHADWRRGHRAKGA